MAKCLYFRQTMATTNTPPQPAPVTTASSRPASSTQQSFPTDSGMIPIRGQEQPQQHQHQQQLLLQQQSTSSTSQPSQTSSPVSQQSLTLSPLRLGGPAASPEAPFSASSSLPVSIGSSSFSLAGDQATWSAFSETPSLQEAILDTDIILRNIELQDDASPPTTSSGSVPLSSASTLMSSSGVDLMSGQYKVEDDPLDIFGSSLGSGSSHSLTNAVLNLPLPPQPPVASHYLSNQAAQGNQIKVMDQLQAILQNSTKFDEIYPSEPDVSSTASTESTTSSVTHAKMNNIRGNYNVQPPSVPSSLAATWPKSPCTPATGLSATTANSVRPIGPIRALATGLDTIPEDAVTDTPTIYQPLVPPMVPKPTTTTYNISFPSPPALRFNDWRSAQSSSVSQPPRSNVAVGSPITGNTSSVPQSPGSVSSQQSPFHGATRTNPVDHSEFQPMNIVESDLPSPSTASSRQGRSQSNSTSRGKRSRRTTPNNRRNADEEDRSDGASSRQRRKSSSSGAPGDCPGASGSATVASAGASGASGSDNKRRDHIKSGLDELQRVIPHIGTPEEEKISQASVLIEAGKYIQTLQRDHDKLTQETEAVNKEIDELNNQIEAFQNQLPANGAPLLPKVMSLKGLADQFHDHVVEKTLESWQYWVFTNIMGHFVHSFDENVSASDMVELEKTSVEWMAKHMNLQQLRRDAYRKLAKLCAKTSIVENPKRLPEEAIAFVSRGEISTVSVAKKAELKQYQFVHTLDRRERQMLEQHQQSLHQQHGVKAYDSSGNSAGGRSSSSSSSGHQQL